MRALAAEPAAGFAAGYSRFISRDGTALPTGQPQRAPSKDSYVHLLRRNRIRNPAMVMFRRDVVSRAGGFSAGIDACADYDLYLRISRAWPVAFHDQVVADYRKHGGNMSDNSALMLRQLRSVMRRQRPYLVDPARQEAFREGLRNIRSVLRRPHRDAAAGASPHRPRLGAHARRCRHAGLVPSFGVRRAVPSQARGDVEPGWHERAAAGALTSPHSLSRE